MRSRYSWQGETHFWCLWGYISSCTVTRAALTPGKWPVFCQDTNPSVKYQQSPSRWSEWGPDELWQQNQNHGMSKILSSKHKNIQIFIHIICPCGVYLRTNSVLELISTNRKIYNDQNNVIHSVDLCLYAPSWSIMEVKYVNRLKKIYLLTFFNDVLLLWHCKYSIFNSFKNLYLCF